MMAYKFHCQMAVTSTSTSLGYYDCQRRLPKVMRRSQETRRTWDVDSTGREEGEGPVMIQARQQLSEALSGKRSPQASAVWPRTGHLTRCCRVSIRPSVNRGYSS